MTKTEAKRLAKVLWVSLRDNAPFSKFVVLCEELGISEEDSWGIIGCKNQCPFCEVFYKDQCIGCPLNPSNILNVAADARPAPCEMEGEPYKKWRDAKNSLQAPQACTAAQAILDIIDSWNV